MMKHHNKEDCNINHSMKHPLCWITERGVELVIEKLQSFLNQTIQVLYQWRIIIQ